MPTPIHPSRQIACPPLPVVHIALVGMGQRGLKTLERYAYIEGTVIVCVADLDASRTARANARLTATGRPAARPFSGPDAWREACRMSEVDLVYICTDWTSHTPIALEAMRCGKHVAVEVPAATTMADCWRLVETAEATRRHCFMTENCCYDRFALETLEMHRRGLFGQITHCEGGYLHCLTEAPADPQQRASYQWIEQACTAHAGNAYPTHAIGPIAQLLDFRHNDRMVSIVSLSPLAQSPEGQRYFASNTSLIRTARGVSILLQLDVTTPRPYSRLQTICGTQGFAQKYPLPTLQLRDKEALTGHAALTGGAALEALSHYDTSDALKLWLEGREKQVPNEMNYAMDARLIYCLRHGLPLDIDVYDAAEWSCLAELSQRSAELGGVPVEVPEFRNRTNRT